MPQPLTTPDLSREEYRALRATIRERGSVRTIVIALTFPAWAMLAIATAAALPLAPFTLLPLLVLMAGFEVVLALHVGVERIGRFVQARYEAGDEGLPAWEHAAMRIGQAGMPSAGVDPLFGWPFAAAVLLNLLPLSLVEFEHAPEVAGVPVVASIVALVHLLALARLWRARRFAATQRARELDHFRQR